MQYNLNNFLDNFLSEPNTKHILTTFISLLEKKVVITHNLSHKSGNEPLSQQQYDLNIEITRVHDSIVDFMIAKVSTDFPKMTFNESAQAKFDIKQLLDTFEKDIFELLRLINNYRYEYQLVSRQLANFQKEKISGWLVIFLFILLIFPMVLYLKAKSDKNNRRKELLKSKLNTLYKNICEKYTVYIEKYPKIQEFIKLPERL